MKKVKWWIRWWVKYFPGLAYNRLVKCRQTNHGPWYDGYAFCMTCGKPWFGQNND